MAIPAAPQPLDPKSIQGLKYFSTLKDLLARLHEVGTARDTAGNRHLFCDQYVGLLLLYYFNPTLTSLRGIQQASLLENVQKALGCQKTSLGSLNEAARVFDADCLKPILTELAAKLRPMALSNKSREAELLAGLTAVDGTLLPALPKMFWALWNYEHSGTTSTSEPPSCICTSRSSSPPPCWPSSPPDKVANANRCCDCWSRAASMCSTGVTRSLRCSKRSWMRGRRSSARCVSR